MADGRTDARPATAVPLCRYCQRPVDHLPPGWEAGDPPYCSDHHDLAGDTPLGVGLKALDSALWLHDLPASDLIRWPWRAVHELAGPLVPGRLTYVAAFPGNGKTTFLTHCLHAWLAMGHTVTYLPLEADPGEVFTRLACLELGQSADDALSKRLREWADAGDAAAQAAHDALTARYHAMMTDRALLEALRIEPLDALTPAAAARTFRRAMLRESDVVVIDHVDHVEDEGGSRAEIAVSNELQTLALRAAKAYKLPIVLATQLNSSRTGGDRLAHYRPPLVDWLYNKAKKEQVAANILGLARTLRTDLDGDALTEARQGRRDIASVVAPDRMGVTGMKLRYGGSMKERTVLLDYTRGRLRDLDDDAARDTLASRHGIPMGSPSDRRAA